MSSFNNDRLRSDLRLLPNDIFTRVDEAFFSIVRKFVDGAVAEILKIQLINSGRKLLNTSDVFAFFQIESEETDDIKSKCCFKSKTGQYIVKPGVRTDLLYLVDLFKRKLEEERELLTKENRSADDCDLDTECVKKNPVLKSLIKWYRLTGEERSESRRFLTTFIDNLAENLPRSPNTFRYSESIKNFALCLYILGGKQAYEFVRLNLYGSLPNLTTIQNLIKESDLTVDEARFKFELLENKNLEFGFCSEDMTGVLRKIEYNTSSNSFVGFVTPLIDGVPVSRAYQAKTFDDLKMSYEHDEIAPLLNIHMFQSLPTDSISSCVPKPFMLSAYGANGRFTALDVIHRWMYIFHNCLAQNVRVIGFSTDADSRYLSAMRITSGFFASSPNVDPDKTQHAFEIRTSDDWTWFFLRKHQMFLFFQDSVHLVTKWRNRLLSSTADLDFGNYKISISHVEKMIDGEEYTKLDHGLTKSDINPKDRQNYRSCIRLISDDVLNILEKNEKAYGTVVYLKLLEMIVRSYITTETNINDRIGSAWCVVFVCRIWLCYLKLSNISKSFIKKSDRGRNGKKSFSNSFLTKPAYISVELNAHYLLYLVLLVKQGDLPKRTLRDIHLYNSQPCESMFRDARSMSGSFSTMINFTVNNFIQRSRKLSILNQFKYDRTNSDLCFPIYQKYKSADSSSPSYDSYDIERLDVEQIIRRAYDQAIEMVRPTGMLDVLKQKNLINFNDLNNFILNDLKKNSTMFNYSSERNTTDDAGEEFEMSDEEEETTTADQLDDINTFDFEEDAHEYEELLNSTKSEFEGIRIFDEINPKLKPSFFKIKINGNVKYLHKQSACWLLTKQLNKLSNDRLSRVMQ